MSVLDAGCGLNAFHAAHCLKQGAHSAHAIDINAEAIGHIREVHPGIIARSGSLMEFPYDDGTFDLVICSGVAHHTEKPERSISELFRVLKPGGTAWISLYCFRGSLFEYLVRAWRMLGKVLPYSLLHAIFKNNATINNFVLDHMYVPVLWIYTNDEVQKILRQTGFQPIQDFPSRFDFFQGKRLGKMISGDGLLRIYIARKKLD